MTISNGYTTLAELKLRIGNMADTDANRDASLEAIIETCSRAIDDYAGFHLYADANDTTRYFTAYSEDRCLIDNLVSITTLATDGDASRSYSDEWSATDYDLQPDNASGDPYQWIITTPQGMYVFPLWRRGVKVVGKFGWASSTPKQAAEACLLMAEQLWLRKDKPFGMSGGAGAMLGADLQSMMYADPHIKSLLMKFKRYS